MRPVSILGVALIVLGSISLAIYSLSIMIMEKPSDTVVSTPRVESESRALWPSILGGGILVSGIVLVLVGAKSMKETTGVNRGS